MMKTPRMLAALVVSALFAIAGCGGGGDDSGGTPQAEKATQAKASGDVDVVHRQGHDRLVLRRSSTTSTRRTRTPTSKLIELPTSADDQRRLQVQRLRAKSSECDVLGMDVIWTAEYAAQGWLKDVSDYISQNGDKFIKSTVDTTSYEGKNWAVPFNSNAGFIYYRTDEVNSAPKDWETLYKEAADKNGIVYQGFRYEGLTVNFLELLYSKGGSIVSDDGKTATADSQEVKDVLKFMARRHQERLRAEGRHDLQGGGVAARIRVRQRDVHAQLAVRLRARQELEDRGQVRHRDLPGLLRPAGRRRARRLQPRHLGLLEEPRGLPRVHRVRHEAGSAEDHGDRGVPAADDQRDVRRPGGQEGAAVRGRAEDRDRAGASRGRCRRSTRRSREAVYNNVYDALQGKASPDDAAKKMNDEIQKALQTF